MRRIINTIRSKRGIAIELAIFVILLTTALSIILIANAMQESNISADAKEDLKDKITVSEIGEMAVAQRESGGESYEITMSEDDTYTVYRTINGNEETLTVTKDDETIITIKLNEEGRILSWE